MFSELREYCKRRNTCPDVFFRDDDADQDVPQLRRLLSLFDKREVPVSLAVIPATLSEEGARLLRAYAAGPCVELHQHGWAHTNHETQGRQCEFGPSRNLEQQRADIARGRERLSQMLHERYVSIFTPPWNRCTADTCRALCELGFAAISKDQSPRLDDGGLTEVSIAVDIFTWKDGPRLNSPDRIAAKMIEAGQRSGAVGILLHHKVMSDEAFLLLEALLEALTPVARFHSLEAACGIRI